MPTFKTSRRVAHAASDMFALVADIERYPEFVPLCQALRIVRRERNDGHDVIVARMTVAYKIFSESFTCRVELQRNEGVILVSYLDGPFRRMENRWVFAPAGEQECDVGFFLDYEFRSKTLAMLMGSVFDRAFRKFSAAFEARADEIYGKSNAFARDAPRPA